jgi:hypothetical protein
LQGDLTPLLHAAKANRKKLQFLLIKAGANVDAICGVRLSLLKASTIVYFAKIIVFGSSKLLQKV